MKSRKGQLLSQHLESVSRDLLDQYQDIVKDYVRGRHGIYALFKRKKLYYVGLAKDLRNRLRHHLKDGHAKKWDRFSVYLTIKDEHMHELEALVLRITLPKGNRQMGKLVRSQDLRSNFKRAIKSKIDDIFDLPEKRPTSKLIKFDKKSKKPVLAPFATKRYEIRLRYKGKLYKAAVRKDGSILLNGSVFNSPSLAARAVIGRAANGWKAWKYERAPGDWVALDTLRKK